MICELVRQGKTVGVTANSHKVIRNLIDAALDAACEAGARLRCGQKTDQADGPREGLSFTNDNKEMIAWLGVDVSVGGGTAWFWARPDAFETVDVLFVDEAAQMSLANVLAVSHSAKTVVLIGDPQQLDQPMQGSHPDGTDVSALDHILVSQKTLSRDKGLFLPETWRLHPDISAYTSELFYESKLGSRAGLDQQIIKADGPVSGSGLRYLPVEHHGNQNCSPEEAEVLCALVKGVLESNATWIDRDGQESPVTLNDIVIITPYNAQVFEIQRRLPGARGRHGGQVPGPGGPSRHLLHRDVKPRGRAARNGVPLQLQPAQRRHVQGQVPVDPGGLAATLPSRVPHPQADATGECLLPLS